MHLLLVEDNPRYREQAASFLQKQVAGIHSLRMAGSVEEAVELVNSDHPLDVMVTDTQLKGGSCVDILWSVNRKGFAVICMSSDERDYRARAMIAAGFPFYSKMSDPTQLLALLVPGAKIMLTDAHVHELRKRFERPAGHENEEPKNWLHSVKTFFFKK